MSVNINWGMAQPTNYSNSLLSGMQAGRQNAAEQHAADAMTAFQADPTNAAAQNSLLLYHPQGAAVVNALKSQRNEDAIKAAFAPQPTGSPAAPPVTGGSTPQPANGGLGVQPPATPAPQADPSAPAAAVPSSISTMPSPSAQPPAPSAPTPRAAPPIQPDGSFSDDRVAKYIAATGDMASGIQLHNFLQSANEKQVKDASEAAGKLASFAVALKTQYTDPAQRKAAAIQAATTGQLPGVTPARAAMQAYDDGSIDAFANGQLALKDNLARGDAADKQEHDDGQKALDRKVTMRGQDVTAATARAGQAVTMRGQNMTHADNAADRVGSSGSLTPEGLTYAIGRYRADGTIPAVGNGNAGAATRSQIVNGAASAALAEGATGAGDAAGAKVFHANAASLQKQTVLHDFTVQAESTAVQNGKLVMKIARDGGAGTTGSPFFNQMQQSIRDNMAGNPDVSALGQAINTYATEVAKVNSGSNGSMAPSDSSRKEILEFLSRAKTLPQLEKMMATGATEMANRRGSMETQIAETIKSLHSNAAPPLIARPSTAPTYSYDIKGKRL